MARRGSRSTTARRTLTPSNKIRIFIPPPEALLARSLVFTLASITWYIINSDDFANCANTSIKCDCGIVHGYDTSAAAEYVEVSCKPGCSIDTIIPPMWNMRTSSFTQSSWDNIKLSYNEDEQKYVWKAGGFISRRPRGSRRSRVKDVKDAQDRVITNPLRYFYARGFATEAHQDEQIGATPKPRRGFIDLLLSNLSGLISALDLLRDKTAYPQSPEARAMTERVLNVLLGDLGDGSLGLREAVQTLFDPHLNDKCLIKKNLIVNRIPGLKREIEFAQLFGDIVGWVYRLLVAEILYKVSEESIELLPRWPSIMIVSYSTTIKSARRREDEPNTRLMEAVVIGGEDLLLAYHSIASAAEELGLSPYKLLAMLRSLPGCIIEAVSKRRLDESGARAIAAQLTPLYDSILQGRVDRDIFYSVIRNLSSVSGIEDVKLCSHVLRLARGG